MNNNIDEQKNIQMQKEAYRCRKKDLSDERRIQQKFMNADEIRIIQMQNKEYRQRMRNADEELKMQ